MPDADRWHGALDPQRLARGLVRQIFSKLLQSREIAIATDGIAEAKPGSSEHISLQLPNLGRTLQILVRPTVMLGQSYVDGHWSVPAEQLYDFLHIIRSQEHSKLLRWFVFANPLHIFRDLLKQHLMPIRATRAVATHYNTDPEFMLHILGPSLSYTCALFENNSCSLEAAQDRKLRTIADRLSLSPGDTVLDLGCGWGYPAVPLAEAYGCRVTGLTISAPQRDFCIERARASAARAQLEFVKSDFMEFNPERSYTKVVSVGMLEHVGKRQYGGFFDCIADFLVKDGVALIHGMVDTTKAPTDGWVDKNIFPGGYIPAIAEVIEGVESSRCELTAVATHSKFNYFQTLKIWRDNLLRNHIKCSGILARAGLSSPEVEATIR